MLDFIWIFELIDWGFDNGCLCVGVGVMYAWLIDEFGDCLLGLVIVVCIVGLF